ncbi:MAG: nuclear transport factor 2 family protein [Sphingobium sp.]
MTGTSHQIARDFFSALTSGQPPVHLLADDMTAWTTSSGTDQPRDKYAGGIQMLASLFQGGLQYSIDSLTAEEDRVAAEVRAEGILVNGDIFRNRYVFLFRIRDGQIASVAEHFNPDPVREKIIPLLQAAMAKQAG